MSTKVIQALYNDDDILMDAVKETLRQRRDGAS